MEGLRWYYNPRFTARFGTSLRHFRLSPASPVISLCPLWLKPFLPGGTLRITRIELQILTITILDALH